jgi:GT2 family glycosyltransferase
MGADEVIVVDDASPERDGDWVEENFPMVEVLRNVRNLGFGRTVIKGVEAAGKMNKRTEKQRNRETKEYVILLNQDVNPDKNILKYLREDFEDESVFGVSFAEQQYGPTRGVFRDGLIVHESVDPIPKKLSRTFWVNGGSCAIRKKYWNELGGFNPIYDPGYWEDIDLSYRAHKRGWKVLWDPRAKVEHVRESTFGGKYYDQHYKRRVQERNHLLFNWLNLEDRGLRGKFYFSLLKRIAQHPGYLRIVWMACIQLLRSGRGVKRENDSPIKDFEILKILN